MKDLNHYFLNRKITRHKLETFLRKYRTDAYTLDIGCGEQPYNHLFPNSIHVDYDNTRKPDVVADIHHLEQFEDNTFECILCTEVLEHCYAPWIAADELFRVLKPGGLLLLSTRFIYPLHDTPTDYYRYTKYGLQQIFRQFHILELQEEAATEETIGIIFQRLAFQTKTKHGFIRLWWFILAELYGQRHHCFCHYGNLRHNGNQENILSSGYYLALQKPKIEENR